eukprot:SAG22_NODE_14_length_33165_cov_13.196698_36_plen_312_part_00
MLLANSYCCPNLPVPGWLAGTRRRSAFLLAEHAGLKRFLDAVVVANVLQLVAGAPTVLLYTVVLTFFPFDPLPFRACFSNTHREPLLPAATAFPDVSSMIAYLLAGQWLVIGIYLIEAAVKCVAYGGKTYAKDFTLELFIIIAMITATLEWQVRGTPRCPFVTTARFVSCYTVFLCAGHTAFKARGLLGRALFTSLQLRKAYGFDSGGTWIFQALQCFRVLRLAPVLGQHSAKMRKMYYTVSVSLPQVLNLVMAMAIVFNVFSVFARWTPRGGATPASASLTTSTRAFLRFGCCSRSVRHCLPSCFHSNCA